MLYFLAMAPIAFIFFLATFLAISSSLLAHKPQISSRISVVGVVYCDTCSTKSFSKHSYFLPGVDVHIQCRVKANSPRTTEQIDFTVNRTTDNHGTYKLELSNLDGVDCIDTSSSSSSSISLSCQATIIKSSISACEIPLITSTSDQITIKSNQENHCIYSLNALSYQPRTINQSLCKGEEEEVENLQNGPYSSSNSYNSSKFFLPFFPPYWPPFPYIPFPPFTYPQPPPSLPFPFPPIPPSPAIFWPPSAPPGFNLGDPRTWVSSPPPPPPPTFNLGDPRTWVPYLPPSPPNPNP